MSGSNFLGFLIVLYVAACVIFKTTFVPELIQLIRIQRVWGKYRPRMVDLYMHPMSRVQNDRIPARVHFKAEQMRKLAAQIARKPIQTVLDRISAAADALYSQEIENQARQPSQNYAMAGGLFRDQVLASLNKQENFATNFPIFDAALLQSWTALVQALPAEAFSDVKRPLAYVPLIETMPNFGRDLHGIIQPLWNDDNQQIGLFDQLTGELQKNTYSASGATYPHVPAEIVEPQNFRGTPRQVLDAYLKNTPLHPIFETPVPFDFTEELGQHAVLIAPSGWGKTNFMHSLVLHLLSQSDPPTVIVLNSQGRLLKDLQSLSIFAPGTSLSDRLVIIDPEDQRPPALNPFVLPTERIAGYSHRIREQIENGTIETFEYLFGSVANELTAKQSTLFSFIIRLLLSRKSTLQDFLDLLNEKTPDDRTPYTGRFAGDIAKMDPITKGFFRDEFFTRAYSETRHQVRQRILRIINTPTFNRMFGAAENKFDLFALMNRGAAIFVNTSRAQLGRGGSTFFGRWVISMVIRASYERVAVNKPRRVLLLIDEASDYVDENFAQILQKVRQFNVGCLMAFQDVGQITVLSAVLGNTAVKLVGGVEPPDAKAVAGGMRTTPEFILSMNYRKGVSTDFATYVRGKTQTAIRMSIPYQNIERMPRMSAEDQQEILARNRKHFGVTPTTTTVTITESQARTGAKVDVSFAGKKFTVTVPPGTQSGRTLRLKDAIESGDLYIKIVVVPDPSPARPPETEGDDGPFKPSKDY